MFGFGKRPKTETHASNSAVGSDQLGFDFAPVHLPPAQGGKQRWIQLGVHAIPYTLKRSSRKSIGFTINAQGLSVTAPRWSLIIEIDAALQSKKDWILSKLAQTQHTKAKSAPAQRWAHGELLPYLGKHVILNVGSGTPQTRLQHGMFEAETLHLALAEDATEAQIKDTACAWLQSEAIRIFTPRITHFEALLGVKVVNWRLSNASTRWGSASSNGHVRLHWRLMHFSPDVIDYVIAHELAHLREMNHSERFWNVVESVLPNYEASRKILKKHHINGLDAH